MVFALLVIVRWRIEVGENNLSFTPLFGKNSIDSQDEINFIDIYEYSYKMKQKQDIRIFLKTGKPIIFSYSYSGVQMLLERFKDKIKK